MEVEILAQPQHFIEKVEPYGHGRIFRVVGLLRQAGHLLRMPYSKNISRDIFELRIIGKQNIRLIYSFKNGKAIIFYAFFKKTEQINGKDFKELMRRYKHL